MRYGFFMSDGTMNRVVAKKCKRGFRFRLVSDYPLTRSQIIVIQEELGYPEFPFDSITRTEHQKQRFGKNVHWWYCFPV